MSQPTFYKGGSRSGHLLVIDNTEKRIQRAKKRAEKDNKPKFKVIKG